ncbi:MAG: RagB/SusD family nutrient uptake outer membrane protein [Parabacteroides sp.]|nr:RagB/SusD family nutrient uptake outer membrane protein [Parabacteroides sp.]
MTFTGYSGADPEWNTAADYSNGTVQGLDFAILPQPRQFVFGINLIYNFKEKSCMKRKIYYTSPIWGLLLIQTSCDSILNQTPANYVSNSEIYSTVNQANQVIDKVTLLNNVSNTQKMRIISEATLIRSLAFFDLARTWGILYLKNSLCHTFFLRNMVSDMTFIRPSLMKKHRFFFRVVYGIEETAFFILISFDP